VPGNLRSAIWKTTDIGKSFIEFASDIKLSHSVFALPFAAAILFLEDLAAPTVSQLFWLLLAMVGARSFAMGFNRYTDRVLDFGNPRTRQRAIPAGRLSPYWSMFWTLVSAGLLILAAFALNPLAGYCSLPVLVLLAFYSYWKRFSWACHWYLGFCLGMAPVAVCVALNGEIPIVSVLLGGAIALWTAGFDIIYALQDVQFDGEVGLRSVPSRFGVKTSLWISRGNFLLMILGLVGVGILVEASLVYYLGVLGIATFLAYEHYMIRDIEEVGPKAKLNKAFFNQNAYISLFYLATVILNHMVQV
jgi:4-hydroxybenzoate polyprenyltransferase